jgi:xanthine/CO dehydrogenase XdhC/CoxF family maturation factor
LAKLGKAMNHTISVAALRAERESFPDCDLVQTNLDLSQVKIAPQTFIVVSTQGDCDEGALEKALLFPASYVAFVASRAKTNRILDVLKSGVSPPQG